MAQSYVNRPPGHQDSNLVKEYEECVRKINKLMPSSSHQNSQEKLVIVTEKLSLNRQKLQELNRAKKTAKTELEAARPALVEAQKHQDFTRYFDDLQKVTDQRLSDYNVEETKRTFQDIDGMMREKLATCGWTGISARHAGRAVDASRAAVETAEKAVAEAGDAVGKVVRIVGRLAKFISFAGHVAKV
ncbi:hypothetical protein ColKHC_06639 [Colletotrichum higginsianum]|nr:hypothetical protein ColKHC_06639 [Colletotrichum higginsianum]